MSSSQSQLPAAAADVEFILQRAVEGGWLTADEAGAARAAVAEAAGEGEVPPLEMLERRGVLNARRIAGLLAAEFNLGLAPDLTDVQPGREALDRVPRALAVKLGVLPLDCENGRLCVAISDPIDTDALDTLEAIAGMRLEPVVAVAGDIAMAIERCYGPESGSIDEWLEALAAEHSPGEEPASRAGEEPLRAGMNSEAEAPVIRLVHRIIGEAVRRRASDIHLEPLETRFRVRYRIDGVLVEMENPPRALHLPVISRIKIMANISIAEKRVPQDGRIQIAMQGRHLDLRVSSIPTVHGESIVMRILDREGLRPGLRELGFLKDDAAAFDRLITLPDGMLLVTGPTGSGKTTTLYSCLHHLNQPDRKIITVEDPVEYQISGINQVPVRQDVGMTFASALRAMLRQAPNIIMVGEIRDLETAEIAIHASLTGHMVFSTLHTNDAAGAVARLIDLGVKPFLIASALRGVLAQRLVRRICARCRRPFLPGLPLLRALNLDPERTAGAGFARGEGCAECNGTGYFGRMGLFELLSVNEEIQQLIHENAGTLALREKARSLGMQTLREDGARKVSAGLTTFEEVVSITLGDAS